jgi:hypothetical protein
MADANPGIGGLGVATPLTLEEFTNVPGAMTAPPAAAGPPAAPDPLTEPGGSDPVNWRTGDNRPAPNLGPPPPRLDWRKRRS